MARATGIHVSGSTVRIAEVEGSDKKLKLRGFGVASVAAGPEEDRVAALVRAFKEAFKASKAGKEHVILGIPARDCIIREITVPFTEPDQIAKVIKFESEPHLHSCTIDEVVIAFHKVGAIGNRSIVLVIAAKKDKIRQILEAAEKCGVDPLAIDVDAAGLISITQHLKAVEDRRNYVVAEVGATATLISLVQDKTPRIVRSVRIGHESISSRVSKDLDINPAEARTRTHQILQMQKQVSEDLFVKTADVADTGAIASKSSNEIQSDIVRQRSVDLIGRLEQEIIRTVDTVKLADPIECVYLTGAGANIPRIEEELAQRLKVAVNRLDVFDDIDYKMPTDGGIVRAESPIAIGLAAKHLGIDPLKFDFRQEEFVFAKKFDRLKVPLLCSVILLAFVNACWYVYEMKARERLDQKLEQIASRASDEFDRLGTTIAKTGDDQKISGVDAQKLAKTKSEAKDKRGHEKLMYLGSTVKSYHLDLRKRYNLDQNAGRGPSVSKNSSSEGSSRTVRFVSATHRWEQVWKAILETGIRDISVNSLKVTSSQVDISLTLPSNWPHKERGDLDIQRQLGFIRERLETLKADGYVSMEWPAAVERKDGHGWDVPNIKIEFQKEE